MYHFATSAATLLALTSTALSAPTTLNRRAGAPMPRPTTGCNITEVDPTFPNWGNGFRPSYGAPIYTYTLNEPYQLASEETLLENCLTTCAGFGNPNDCQGVFLSYEFPDMVVVPNQESVFGSVAPASQQVGCALFSTGLVDFELTAPVFPGTFTSAKALNIVCPVTAQAGH